jgi:hypothetical protein
VFSGGDKIELGAYYEPFKDENKCISWANKNGFNIPEEDGKNILTNKDSWSFTITEIEVWEVEFIE